ncbi:MAG: ribosome silencing factor [Betaproteobacteria bacterium]|nr:ribosome silencing factor [Betaproteobacteria bacterium]
MRLDRMVKAVVRALEDIKAKDVVVLDVTGMTSLFDRMIVASADSTRQTKALSGNVQEKLKALGAKVYGVEGEQAGEWVLVDLGPVLVHIMQPAVRTYYNIEELWGGARPGTPKTRSRRAAAAPASRRPA